MESRTALPLVPETVESHGRGGSLDKMRPSSAGLLVDSRGVELSDHWTDGFNICYILAITKRRTMVG